jgi:hypothetical protein
VTPINFSHDFLDPANAIENCSDSRRNLPQPSPLCQLSRRAKIDSVSAENRRRPRSAQDLWFTQGVPWWRAFIFDRGITADWIPDELGNTCDLARQHCRTRCFPRQTRSATLRKRTETLPPSSCANRGGALGVTSRCLVFDLEKAPLFSLSSCR